MNYVQELFPITFSTLGCLHAVIQSLKMFELAFNHLSLLQVVAGVTSKKK